MTSFISCLHICTQAAKKTSFWLHFSRDIKTIPDIFLLLQFLEEKIRTMPTHSPNKTINKIIPRETKFLCMQLRPRISGGDWHALYLCPSYKSMSIDNRSSQVRSTNLCFNFLGSGHRTKECRSMSHLKQKEDMYRSKRKHWQLCGHVKSSVTTF